jgi:uncharacterized membrane protein YgcG
MAGKRTKKLTLVLLGSLGAVSVSGCGGCGAQNEVRRLIGGVDRTQARQAAAAGAAAQIMDGVALTTSLLAASPVTGPSGSLNLANLASILDQADETLDVIANESGVPRPTNTQTPHRSHYYYHRSPGIGWFVWGYTLGRMNGSPSYVPPRTYAPSPRPLTQRSSGGSGIGGGSSGGFGRSSPMGGGGVSRGGFGSSGAAHASGGS